MCGKAFALPTEFSFFPRLRLACEAEPLYLEGSIGKAKPFRTSGGEAAQTLIVEQLNAGCSYSPDISRGDFRETTRRIS
jgi:hypothetical protein